MVRGGGNFGFFLVGWCVCVCVLECGEGEGGVMLEVSFCKVDVMGFDV